MSQIMPALRADLAKAKGRWPQMASETGVSHSTISRIYRGEIPTPQINTFEKLRGWLDTNLGTQ